MYPRWMSAAVTVPLKAWAPPNMTLTLLPTAMMEDTLERSTRISGLVSLVNLSVLLKPVSEPGAKPMSMTFWPVATTLNKLANEVKLSGSAAAPVAAALARSS